jgi:hypothetical protein
LYSEKLDRPDWIERGVEKECYSNCLKQLIRHPDKVVYCEGFATSVIPVQHAWLLFEGRVIDPTWDPAWDNQHNREYFGIAFKTEYVKRIARESGYYGVLDNFVQGYPMLRGVHKPDDFLHDDVKISECTLLCNRHN